MLLSTFCSEQMKSLELFLNSSTQTLIRPFVILPSLLEGPRGKSALSKPFVILASLLEGPGGKSAYYLK